MTKHKFTRQDAITLKDAVALINTVRNKIETDVEALNHMDMLMYPIEETIDAIEGELK